MFYRSHMVDVHSMTELGHKCNLCDKYFGMIGRLRDHLKFDHEQGKQFKCDECNKIFASAQFLNNHTKKVHDKLSKCKECNKLFLFKYRLRFHMKEVHEKIKTFECDLCHK